MGIQGSCQAQAIFQQGKGPSFWASLYALFSAAFD